MAERSPQELEQTPVEEARQKLKDECEQLWLKVQKLQEKVKEVRSPVKVEKDNIALSVRNHKVKALKAQIESRRQQIPEGLPTDRPVLEALLLDDLEKATHQLKQLSTIVSSQNEELREKIDREKRWLQEQNDVNEALKQKIDALGVGAGGNITKQSLLKKLDKERQTVVKYNTKRMKQLKEFIEEHIPEPTEEAISKWAKQRSRQSVETVPMITILEELINKSISTPHEPYITATESHWPQFTEFLLRFSIAQKHPEDDSKLRVTPFHL